MKWFIAGLRVYVFPSRMRSGSATSGRSNKSFTYRVRSRTSDVDESLFSSPSQKRGEEKVRRKVQNPRPRHTGSRRRILFDKYDIVRRSDLIFDKLVWSRYQGDRNGYHQGSDPWRYRPKSGSIGKFFDSYKQSIKPDQKCCKSQISHWTWAGRNETPTGQR